MVDTQDKTDKGSADMGKLVSLDEAAQSLGVSRDAIRKRIRRGKLKAEKRKGLHGDQYYIPESEIDTAREVKEVIPVTRSLDPDLVRDIITRVVAEANEPFKRELLARIDRRDRQLTEKIEALEELREEFGQTLADLETEQTKAIAEVLAAREESITKRIEELFNEQSEVLNQIEQQHELADTHEKRLIEILTEQSSKRREQIDTVTAEVEALKDEQKKSWWARLRGR